MGDAPKCSQNEARLKLERRRAARCRNRTLARPNSELHPSQLAQHDAAINRLNRSQPRTIL